VTSQTNRTDATTFVDVGEYAPESYLAAVTELIRAAHDEEAAALVKLHGAAMLPQLSPEQLVHLTSLMEGAGAAIEAAALVSQRHARRPAAAS
jgi:hypothetical protein